MPQYTVKDEETGKTITFAWHSETPPTDADLADVFAASKEGGSVSPAFASKELSFRQAPSALEKGIYDYAYPAMGGIVGALAGGMMPPGNIPGAVIGGITGAAGMSQGSKLMQQAQGYIEPKSFGQEMEGFRQDMRGAIIGELLGGARPPISRVAPEALERAARFERLGVPATTADVTQGIMPSKIEQALMLGLTSAPGVAKRHKAKVEALNTKALNVIDEFYGGQVNPYRAGQQAMDAVGQRMQSWEELYSPAYKAAFADRPIVPYMNTQRAADEIAEDIANLGMNKDFLVTLQNFTRKEPLTKAEEVLPILGLQKQGITDQFGRTITKVEPGGTARLTGMPTDAIDSHLKLINRLYSVYKNAKDEKAIVRTYLTKLKNSIWTDLDEFAATAEQEGASDFVAKYKYARSLYSAGEGDIPGAKVWFNKHVADYNKPGVEPAQLVNGLFGKKGQNIGEAKVVQKAVGADAWKGFESAWLTSAMRNNEGNFDALRLASQWYQLDPSVKTHLFTDPVARQWIDDLARAATDVKHSYKIAGNPSGTAGAVVAWGLLTGGGYALSSPEFVVGQTVFPFIVAQLYLRKDGRALLKKAADAGMNTPLGQMTLMKGAKQLLGRTVGAEVARDKETTQELPADWRAPKEE